MLLGPEFSRTPGPSFFADRGAHENFFVRRHFFLAPKISGRYAARAKGKGETEKRPVNNLLTSWVCDRVAPANVQNWPKKQIFGFTRLLALMAEMTGVVAVARRYKSRF